MRPYITVIGIFDTPAEARGSIDELSAADLDIQDISVIERDPTRYQTATDYNNAPFEYREYSATELGDQTAAGLVLGSLVGGTLGTLAGLGALVIPGIGPVLAAGPLAGALIGGTTGAVTGTLAGALIEMFEVPAEHAEVYHDRLSTGKTMVAVHVDPQDADGVRNIFQHAKAERFEWDSVYTPVR